MAQTKPMHVARISSLGFNPRGVSGIQSRRLRALKAGRFGPANRGRRLSDEERLAVAEQMQRDGVIVSERGYRKND
jgi:hypothetical protein